MDIDNKDIDRKRKDIEDSYNTIVRDLELSLDKYMKALPETPLSLPIKTKIIITRKGHTIRSYYV
jgi:hypothetical protein